MRSKFVAIGLVLLLVGLSLSVVACEPEECQCGDWDEVTVTETAYWLAQPDEPGGGTMVSYVDCGETVTMSPPAGVEGFQGTVTLNSVFSCIPEGCGDAVVTHYFIDPYDAYTYEDFGNSVELTYGPPYGVYTVVFNATCNGEACDSCEIFVDFEAPGETCTWTECGIINNTSPVNWPPDWTVITFEECDGDAYTLYGPDSLADNMVSLGSYEDCQCAEYCYIEEDGKKIITQWETVSIDAACCYDCCLYCCEVDFSLVLYPGPGDGPGGPPSLCPGESLIYNYHLVNNGDYEIDYDFGSLTPAGQIEFYSFGQPGAGAGTLPANTSKPITIHYQMPGIYNEPCIQSSYTFTHTLNITILNTPDGSVVCTPIESSVFINCHDCLECEHKMHYPQHPDEDGWDVYSCQSESWAEMIQVADDWECTESGLVTDIRFWGSWKDGGVGQITGFWVEIYNNIPEDGNYSRPGDLLWRSFITDFTSGLIEPGCTEGWYDPGQHLEHGDNHDSYYRYDITDIERPFCQEEGTIYWLSVYPVIDGNQVWGWKSSEDNWEDAACSSVHLLPDPQDPVSQYSEYDWYQIYDPPTTYPSVPMDMAFIICEGRPCDTPSIGECIPKMHYPQYPQGENGFSVMATLNATGYYVADDWQCSESGLVTGIRFWGHWNGSGTITSFEIAIAKKISAYNVGAILWQQSFPSDEVSVSNYTTATSGWYNPPADYNNNVGEGYWQYDIENIEDPFCQKEGEEYWLIIGAYVDDPNEGVWGWRNSTDDFGCNAMYSHFLDQGWQPLYDLGLAAPQPIDMAFIICGGGPCELGCQCGEWSPIEITWDDGNPRTTDTVTILCNTSTWLTSLKGEQVYVTASIDCIPPSCELNYSWEVTPPQGQSPVSGYSSGGELEFWFDTFVEGIYEVTLNATCDGVECPPCTFAINISFP